MKIQFLGATQTVTGSKYLLTSGKTRILIDCGLYQGYKWLRERNREPLPVKASSLDAVILTHAHIDHTGYLPVLFKEGFRGQVYCHHATKALCDILLRDAAHLQEEDARFYARHQIGKHATPQPLYDMDMAVGSLRLMKGVSFGNSFHVDDLKITLQPVGHLLGAASVIIEGEGRRVGFSGDVGRPDDLFMFPPAPLPELDVLILESTYGNRRHPQTDPWQQLETIVNETTARGGVLAVPSFAVGRTQILLHMLTRLMEQQRIRRMPIYLDSPMAIDASEIYCEYEELHRLDQAECRNLCQATTFTRTVSESKALDEESDSHIIIAGSGMATGGRILHHMKRLLPDPKNTIMFTGFQAGGTRGANMLSGTEAIKIHGAYVPCKAHIALLDGLSGHADYAEITDWLQQSALSPNTFVYLVHGEPDAADHQRKYIEEHLPLTVKVAEYMQTITV